MNGKHVKEYYKKYGYCTYHSDINLLRDFSPSKEECEKQIEEEEVERMKKELKDEFVNKDQN